LTARRVDARWLVGAIFLLALAVRAAGMGSRLSIDDAYSWFAASSPSAHVFLDRLANYENTPPLIYLVLMVLPGSSPAWLRLPAVLPGALLCPVLWALLRPRLGERPALLAALALAVSPYVVTYSNLARGFMLADLALLGATWALLSLAERPSRERWVVFCLCGVVAMYTEYASAIYWVALALAGLWIGRPRRRPLLLACGLALASLLAWVPEIVRGQDQVGLTKLGPQVATPSVAALRDMVATLALGEHGGTNSALVRWAFAALVLALAAGAGLLIRRHWAAIDPRGHDAIRLLLATLVLTPIGYALVAIVGVDVFTQRYITILVPVVAALGALAVSLLGVRAVTVAAVLLAAVGVGNFARRLGGQWQPDLTPVRQAVAAAHPRSVLTNTPVVVYYLSALHPIFDRPVDLGVGLQNRCARPCVAVDDQHGIFGGPPRAMAGTQQLIDGRFLVTVGR
jgi:uncharacterized membrane protein